MLTFYSIDGEDSGHLKQHGQRYWNEYKWGEGTHVEIVLKKGGTFKNLK